MTLPLSLLLLWRRTTKENSSWRRKVCRAAVRRCEFRAQDLMPATTTTRYIHTYIHTYPNHLEIEACLYAYIHTYIHTLQIMGKCIHTYILPGSRRLSSEGRYVSSDPCVLDIPLSARRAAPIGGEVGHVPRLLLRLTDATTTITISVGTEIDDGFTAKRRGRHSVMVKGDRSNRLRSSG